MTTTEFTVTGMTCGNCIRHVTEEVSEVAGVTAVDVQLDGGRLSVTGDVENADVLAAVAEAGYSAVPA